MKRGPGVRNRSVNDYLIEIHCDKRTIYTAICERSQKTLNTDHHWDTAKHFVVGLEILSRRGTSPL